MLHVGDCELLPSLSTLLNKPQRAYKLNDSIFQYQLRLLGARGVLILCTAVSCYVAVENLSRVPRAREHSLLRHQLRNM